MSLLLQVSNANMFNRPVAQTQGVFRGPLWNMGNNNRNCFLRSPKSDNYTDCQTSRNRALETLAGGGGVLCACPAFSRIRLICSYVSQLRQRKRVKESKENELSALLERFMISHTHSQARASPDTTPLISRPENWRASHS